MSDVVMAAEPTDVSDMALSGQSDVGVAAGPVDSELQQTADESASTDDVSSENRSTETAKPSTKRTNRPQPRLYNCTSCSRSFSSRRDMVTHQYMHRENPTAFCNACNRSFSTEAAYRRHTASHNRKATAASQRPRKICSQCDMQFDSMRELSAHHAAKHVDEKRFVCAICGSQFAWPENLRAHQRMHELDPHECEICSRRFVDATSLRVHVRNSHGPSSETPSPQRKQHSCKLCGRSFQFDFSLRAHMKGHAQSPVAASLRRLKQYAGKLNTVGTMPLMQTKYVRVDSKGVIDLGLDAASQPSEIIVEVYNDTTGGQQSLDFSDVLDHSGRGSDSAEQADHDRQQDSSESKLVWYVKPDRNNEEQAVPPQQQPADDRDADDNKHDDNVTSNEPSVAVSDQNSDLIQPAANSGHADGDTAGDLGASLLTNDAVQQSVVCRHDDDSQHQHPQSKTTDELSTEPVSVESDHKDSDEDDGIDWMDKDPVPRRAAPSFLFRQSSAATRRHTARIREPFLFNCVMTDEKPFICMTCGHCFRWEISLNIHQRLHTDGTFPNKSRGSHSRKTGKQSPRSDVKSPVAKSSVGRSCIVRHCRTSSDEEDDEYTFHVQADGPSEVSLQYPPRRPAAAQRGQGRRRGQRGRGGGMATGAVVIGRKALSASRARSVGVRQEVETKASASHGGGCNGVSCQQQSSEGLRPAMKNGSSQPRRAAMRAGYVCRHCRRVVTSRAAFSRHRRRAHVSAPVFCQLCAAHFTSRWDLRRHCQRVHDAVSGVAKCRRCSRVFADSGRLKQHCRLHRAAVKPQQRLPQST